VRRALRCGAALFGGHPRRRAARARGFEAAKKGRRVRVRTASLTVSFVRLRSRQQEVSMYHGWLCALQTPLGVCRGGGGSASVDLTGAVFPPPPALAWGGLNRHSTGNPIYQKRSCCCNVSPSLFWPWLITAASCSAMQRRLGVQRPAGGMIDRQHPANSSTKQHKQATQLPKQFSRAPPLRAIAAPVRWPPLPLAAAPAAALLM